MVLNKFFAFVCSTYYAKSKITNVLQRKHFDVGQEPRHVKTHSSRQCYQASLKTKINFLIFVNKKEEY